MSDKVAATYHPHTTPPQPLNGDRDTATAAITDLLIFCMKKASQHCIPTREYLMGEVRTVLDSLQ